LSVHAITLGQQLTLTRPWAVACWAPSAFLGIEVNRISTKVAPNGASYRRLSTDHRVNSMDLEAPESPSVLRLEHGVDDGVASTGELSGIYFGILNIYSTLPQFVATFIAMIVFQILEPGKSPELAHEADPSEHHGTDGPNAISVCLFIGGLSAVGAAYASKRLRYVE
jgi:solute carrier family 45 protein 1/2/4